MILAAWLIGALVLVLGILVLVIGAAVLRAHDREVQQQDAERGRLDGFVATRPSVWHPPPDPSRRPSNGRPLK